MIIRLRVPGEYLALLYHTPVYPGYAYTKVLYKSFHNPGSPRQACPPTCLGGRVKTTGYTEDNRMYDFLYS